MAISGNAEAGAQVQLFEGTTLVGEAVANATGSWRVTTSQLRNGTHSLTATATDTAGNTSSAMTAATFTVATLVPTTPQGLRLTALTDSGQSQTDNITNVTTPTIVGTTEAGATVRLFRAQQLLGETIADVTTGAWSIALTTALPEGEQSLRVVAHNAIGDSQTATLTTTIDSVAPTTTQFNVLAAGSSTPTALANGATLTTGTRLLGRVDGTASAIASFQYQLGSSPVVTVPVVANGLFNYRLGRPDWFILVANTLDFILVGGQPDFVRQILGCEPEEASITIRGMSESENINPRVRKYYIHLLEETQITYPKAEPGTVINLGLLNWDEMPAS